MITIENVGKELSSDLLLYDVMAEAKLRPNIFYKYVLLNHATIMF